MGNAETKYIEALLEPDLFPQIASVVCAKGKKGGRKGGKEGGEEGREREMGTGSSPKLPASKCD